MICACIIVISLEFLPTVYDLLNCLLFLIPHSWRVWDIQTGQMINELRRNGYVRALKFNSELLITGSDVS